MLLQTGLLVRVVNRLTGCNLFMAITIYITMGMNAKWYFVYQPALGDKKVAIPYSLIVTMVANSFCRLNMSRVVFSSSRNPLAGSSSFTGSITSPPPFLMTGPPRLERTYLPLTPCTTRFLCNTSGSGKTRLLFKGLWRHFGLYFTVHTQLENIRSGDLGKILGQLQNQLLPLPKEDWGAELQFNWDIASCWFHGILYARLIIFRIFLEHAMR